MQKDQGRVCDALAADHDPLINPAPTEIVDLRDAVRQDLDLGPSETAAFFPDVSSLKS
jgi:hypothetical protein